jgi:hypothetical protein
MTPSCEGPPKFGRPRSSATRAFHACGLGALTRCSVVEVIVRSTRSAVLPTSLLVPLRLGSITWNVYSKCELCNPSDSAPHATDLYLRRLRRITDSF